MHPDLTPPPADALLFDWDGTLVDSQDANFRAMSHTLSTIGILLDEEWFGAALDVDPARCVVYEDSHEGITAAHAAGMRVIDVRPHTGRGGAL